MAAREYWVGFNRFTSLDAAKQYAADRLRRGEYYDAMRPHIAIFDKAPTSGEKLLLVAVPMYGRHGGPAQFRSAAWWRRHDR